MTAKVFAPAKINLTLHVTGQRDDGYHLLDSYVSFADVGDEVTVTLADEMSLTVSGPFAEGVPVDDRNLCWRAAEMFGCSAAIHLEKNLPPASGIGGGSSDAAAVLKALMQLTGTELSFDPIALGADVPVCMVGHSAHMKGIGDWVMPLSGQSDFAVLVNPGVAVSTPAIFKLLKDKNNSPMTPWPTNGDAAASIAWLCAQRNDLQAPACALAPQIGDVLQVLRATTGQRLPRMSGSGATCFALYSDATAAEHAANEIAEAHPDWWVKNCVLS